MGFAGQVFAARVAIGLAVPSPQALSKTGSMLARAITNIQKRIELAKGGRGDIAHKYGTEMAKANKKTLDMTDRMNNEIVARMKNTLKSIDDASNKSMSKSAGATLANYNKIKTILGKDLGDKLTQGMSATTSGFGNIEQMAANIHGMTKEQQRSTLHNTKLLIAAQAEGVRLGYEAAAQMDKSTPEAKKAYELAYAKVEADEEDLKIHQQIYEQMQQTVGLSNQLTSEYGFMNTEVTDFAEGVVNVTNTVRTKFNEALRNSIAILTAIGYKLNQNTQELIEFERELLNANSVFGLTNDELFEVGNSITEFGNNFGIAVQNGATGLYQLASAGLEANEALKVLPHTLKLSMAVQGDHNTISKLTAQTIFGFGMEMSQAAEVTDKFAYAIQKSLIEYQDLSSAVKFALPFFTSTGQSLDQLLGALQILTNRALEAGIAGRGLRQALAEFAESAMDAEAGFRKMGVEIMNAEGEMMQLTEIAAQFAAAVGPETISDTELLTTLIEELNVRGATAFIHLVQASDEFTAAVEDTTNAGGQLDEMVKIQNESLSAQLQILKTNIFSIFALRDASYEGTEYINGFHEAVVNAVNGFKDLIVVTDGNKQSLTEFGQELQKGSIEFVEKLVVLVQELILGIKDLMPTFIRLWEVLLVPLRLVSRILNSDSPMMQGLIKFYMYWKALSMLGIPAMLGGMGKLGMMMVPASVKANATSKVAGAYPMLFGAPGIAAKDAIPGGTSWANRAKTPGLPTTGDWTVGSKKHSHWLKQAGLKGTPAVAAKAPVKGLLARGIGGLVGGPVGWAMTAWTVYELMKMGGLMQTGGYIPQMAGGGSMSANRPYLVGEQGPELFMPGSSGQLLNNGQTNNLLGGPVVLKNVTIGVDSFGGIV